MLNNEAPRRCYVEKMFPAELKIREAVILVEDMGADVRLTDAVVLLGQAKDRVADFVDGIGEHAAFSTKEKFACPCGETTYLLEQNPNHFVGCISHNPTEVEKLKAENEKLEIKLMTLTNNAKGTPWTQGEIEAASSRAAQTERILELNAEVENLKAEIKLANANFEVMKGLYDDELDESWELVKLLKEAIFFWGQFPEFKFDFATYGWERFDKWKDQTNAILKDAAIGHSTERK